MTRDDSHILCLYSLLLMSDQISDFHSSALCGCSNASRSYLSEKYQFLLISPTIFSNIGCRAVAFLLSLSSFFCHYHYDAGSFSVSTTVLALQLSFSV